MSNNKITLILQDEQIKEAFLRYLTPERLPDFIDTLLEVTSNSSSLEVLLRTVMNMHIKPGFIVGETVDAELYSMPSWNMNKEEMTKLGLIQDGHLVRAKIKEINLRRAEPYTIEYSYVKDNDTQPQTGTYNLKDADLFKLPDPFQP